MESENKEAATLPKKKKINRAKVKRTIKNILCRPDPVFWPNITEEQARSIEVALSTYKIDIPEYNKLHWEILKDMPKDQRPKPPKIKKVEGLIFGLTDCAKSLKGKECSAVIIEGTINPRTIAYPLIETCISTQVPILCMNGLRKITSLNFGIPTSCLAIKAGFLHELSGKIEDIAKLHTPQQKNENDSEAQQSVENTQDTHKMEIDENIKQEISNTTISFTYLYRTSKKTRVFNPSSNEPKTKKAFIGQDFIEFSDKPEKKLSEKVYKTMILKRITNNQHRQKENKNFVMR